MTVAMTARWRAPSVRRPRLARAAPIGQLGNRPTFASRIVHLGNLVAQRDDVVLMTTPATEERRALADELLNVGPDAPTLIPDWDAKMMAAHIVLRDRRPDAAAGIVVKQLADHTAKVQRELAQRPFEKLVEEVRHGPPVWSPARIGQVDRLLNTAEFFVHLEDVRRAQPAWEPRTLDGGLVDDLYSALKRMASQLTKSSPVGLTLTATEGRSPITAHGGSPMITVTAPVGELTLWAFGRQTHALVDFDGSPDAIAAAEKASFGL